MRQILILRSRQRVKAYRTRIPSNATEQFINRHLGHTIVANHSNQLMSSNANFQDKYTTITRIQYFNKVKGLNCAPTVVISFERFRRVTSVIPARRHIRTRIRTYHHMSRWSTRNVSACQGHITAYNSYCERSL